MKMSKYVGWDKGGESISWVTIMGKRDLAWLRLIHCQLIRVVSKKWKKRQKINTPSPLSFQAQLQRWFFYFLSPLWSMQEKEEEELQSGGNTLSMPFLFPHTVPQLLWWDWPPVGYKSFMNCYSVVLSNRIHDFRSCSNMGKSVLQEWIAPSWAAAAHRDLFHIVPRGCRGTISVSCSSPLSLYFFPDLGVCRAVFLVFSILSHSCCCGFFFFFFLLVFLKYVITEAQLLLASSDSLLQLSGTVSIQHGSSFWWLLAEAIPPVPVITKLCHVSSIQAMIKIAL